VEIVSIIIAPAGRTEYAVSKKVRRVVLRLQHETTTRVQSAARLLREYRDAIHSSDTESPALQARRMREIDRVVAEYIQLQKQLKRARRKAQLDS
jgi:hypothetical protein